MMRASRFLGTYVCNYFDCRSHGKTRGQVQPTPVLFSLFSFFFFLFFFFTLPYVSFNPPNYRFPPSCFGHGLLPPLSRSSEDILGTRQIRLSTLTCTHCASNEPGGERRGPARFWLLLLAFKTRWADARVGGRQGKGRKGGLCLGTNMETTTRIEKKLT
jgi:hypothetical protein